MFRKSLPMIMAFLVATLGTLLLVTKLRDEILRETARYSAALWSSNLRILRQVYTEEVVRKARKKGIVPAHKYEGDDSKIPYPATLIRILSDKVHQEMNEVSMTLYSPYPFSWIKNSMRGDDLRGKVWKKFRSSNAEHSIDFLEKSGDLNLRYSIPDLMTPECASCHNTHPDSPKRDWKVGEVSGVIEVEVALAKVTSRTEDFVTFYAFAFILIIFLFFGIAYYFLYKSFVGGQNLAAMNRELILMSNHERSKISHHLHDGLGQMVTGASYLLSHILRSKTIHSDQDKKNLEEVSGILRETHQQIRDLAKSLHAEEEERKFERCIKDFISMLYSQFKISVSLNIDWESFAKLSNKESHELYFITVEAINNAIRHGKASVIDVKYKEEMGRANLTIEDNGKGISDPILTPDKSGIGTKIIRYRARMIGWEARLKNLDRVGAVLECHKLKRNS